jgi:cell division protein FtsB
MRATVGIWLDSLRRALRGRWIAIPLAALLLYFGWHAMHGHRGLLAWIDISRQLEAEKQQLAELRAEREALDRRVQGLQPDRLDPDLLEEELRKLGYVKENEVIVLRDPAKAGP